MPTVRSERGTNLKRAITVPNVDKKSWFDGRKKKQRSGGDSPVSGGIRCSHVSSVTVEPVLKKIKRPDLWHCSGIPYTMFGSSII